jgi:hypothetical protein
MWDREDEPEEDGEPIPPQIVGDDQANGMVRRGAWSSGGRRHRLHAPMLRLHADNREAGGGTRTHGLALTRRLLYQLSYSGSEASVANR